MSRERMLMLVLSLAVFSSRNALAATGDAQAQAQTAPPKKDAPTPVDDSVSAPAPPERRYFTLELTPLNFEIRRYGGQIEIMPVEHHAIQFDLYYFNWTTGDDSDNNTFRGVGGEIGYRYYFGDAGPRGFFFGPSFLLGSFQGIPRNGATVDFENIGGAIDIGYQALLLNRLVLGAGFGLQYTAATADLPHQEVPASTIANAGIRPRFLLSLGIAL